MNPISALLSAAILINPLTAAAQEKKAKDAAPANAELTAPQSPEETSAMLKSAFETMSKATSFHASAVVPAGDAKATVEGSLGEGTLSLKGTDPAGKVKLRRVVENKFYLSTDGGKTWAIADETERQMTINLSRLITAPVSAELKVWEKGVFTAKLTTEGKEKLLLLTKPAKDKEPSAQYWLAQDAKTGALLIRKAAITVEATDATFPVTITYTKINEPVKIEAPSIKKQP